MPKLNARLSCLAAVLLYSMQSVAQFAPINLERAPGATSRPSLPNVASVRIQREVDLAVPVKLTIPTIQKIGNTISAGLTESVGTGTRGGGCGVETANSLRFLDFVARKPEYSDARDGVRLIESDVSRRIGFDMIDNANSQKLAALISAIKVRADAWAPSSPVLTKYLSGSVAEFPIYISSLRFQFREKSCPRIDVIGVIRPIALYIRNVGLVISAKDFNRLSFEEQAGLLLHESLRFMQLQMKLGMSDRELMAITDALMVGVTNSANLDSLIKAGPIAGWGARADQGREFATNKCGAENRLRSLDMNSPKLHCSLIERSNYATALQQLYDLMDERFQSALRHQNITIAKRIKDEMDGVMTFALSASGAQYSIAVSDPSYAAKAARYASEVEFRSAFVQLATKLKRKPNSESTRSDIATIRQIWSDQIALGRVAIEPK